MSQAKWSMIAKGYLNSCIYGRLNTMDKFTWQGKRIQSTTVNNEYSQRLAQLSNSWTSKCPEQTYTIQPTTAHNWTTEYSQQLYTTEQMNTFDYWKQKDN